MREVFHPPSFFYPPMASSELLHDSARDYFLISVFAIVTELVASFL